MPRIDNEKFYSSAIQKYGITPRGVHWLSKENQQIRFEVLLNMLPKDISTLTIADAGCGFADLYLYMQKKRRVPKKYIGIDSLSEMYEIASKRSGCEVIIADITKDELPKADYYLCSGAMNVLNSFETHLFIRNCLLSAKKGFIFNILYGTKESDTYNYVSKEQIRSIASDLGIKSVIFKEGYLKADISVGFFKPLKDRV